MQFSKFFHQFVENLANIESEVYPAALLVSFNDIPFTLDFYVDAGFEE